MLVYINRKYVHYFSPLYGLNFCITQRLWIALKLEFSLLCLQSWQSTRTCIPPPLNLTAALLEKHKLTTPYCSPSLEEGQFVPNVKRILILMTQIILHTSSVANQSNCNSGTNESPTYKHIVFFCCSIFSSVFLVLISQFSLSNEGVYHAHT